MAATGQYSAGIEANQTQLSYIMEAAWGVKPAGAFQAIRYMSDTLALTKTRQRPSEINITREASQSVTTQQTAGGSINYALAYAVYDDFFSIALQQDWQAFQVINGAAADITLTVTGGVATLSSGTTNKFQTLSQGSWIKLYGFTATPANNGWWWIQTKTDTTHLILTGPQKALGAATETPLTTLAHIRGSTITNGQTFKAMHLMQKLSSSMWLTYPGSYVSRMTISGGVGNFFTGAIDIIAKDEVDPPTDPTGGAGVNAPPAHTVMDPVNGFVGAFWNGLPIAGSLDQVAITLENQGAAPEYALGSADAVGILGGTFSASGSFRMYFNDFIMYDRFQAETSGALSFIVQGSTGNSYAFTFPNAVIMERVPAGGPGQPVYAEITFEANPDPSVTTSGTIRIDRLAFQ